MPIVHTDGLAQASLALDPGGNFFTGRIFHASARTGWSPTLVIGTDHFTPSLAIDAQGRGHLVCSTGPNTGIPLVVLDVAGRTVRRLTPTTGTGGGVECMWDGRSDAGTTVPAGVYRVVPAHGSRQPATQAGTITVMKLH